MPLDADYDADKTRPLLDQRGLHGRIAHKGEKALFLLLPVAVVGAGRFAALGASSDRED